VDVVVADSLRAYAVVSDSASNTSLVAWDPSRGEWLGTVYAPGGYSLSDVALDDRGELYVCNSSFTSPGLQVYGSGSDEHLAGPLSTGLPPIQIVFDSGETSDGGGSAGAGVSMAPPVPNPASGPVRVVLDLPTPGKAGVEVLDVLGRNVRVLTDRLMQSGPTTVAWDLLDAAGRRVRPGVYWFRAVTPQATIARRFVVLD
jgi:hypothetical protein